MDTVRLVENGAYSDVEERLDGFDKGFIKGIDYCIHNLDGLIDLPSDDDDILDEIRIKLFNGFIDEAKTMLYVSRCEAIVSFGDNLPAE